jgi:hypothetical protein
LERPNSDCSASLHSFIFKPECSEHFTMAALINMCVRAQRRDMCQQHSTHRALNSFYFS